MPQREEHRADAAAAADPADNPLVRAVAAVCRRAFTLKLLVAFVGTALLVVGVGVLGLRLLGQANERVVTLGTLQERAFAVRQAPERRPPWRLLPRQNVGE